MLPEPKEHTVFIRPDDLDISYMRGSGAGGQHRNVTDSACRIKHKPSGLEVRCEAERSQHANRETAMAILRARLVEHQTTANDKNRAEDRRLQIGSGQRGDKIRTIRVQDDQVNDHVTGRSWRFKNYSRGDWD